MTRMIDELAIFLIAVLHMATAGVSYTNLKFWRAAKQGDQDYINKAIASASINVNWKNPDDYYGEAPLHVAADGNSPEIIRSLLNAGANIMLRDDNNQTALMDGSFWGSTEAIKELLAHGADINAQDNRKQTALFKAAKRGHIETAQALINAHADISLADEDGSTPLHISTKENKYDIIYLLLKHGADKSAKDKDGKTALAIAKELRNYPLSNLFETFEHTTIATIDSHINKSTTVRPAIMLENLYLEFWKAAKQGDQAFIDKMIASVNINWKNPHEYGESPLHIAADENRVGIIKSLLNAGADIELRDDNNQTALIDGSWHGSTEAIKELLTHGADVDAQDKWERTALYLAAWNGHSSTVMELLNAHASVNLARDDGRTPLHISTENNKYEVVLLLLQHGADKRIKNGDGKTALDIAKEYYDKRLADLIETYETTNKPTIVSQIKTQMSLRPTIKSAIVTFKPTTNKITDNPISKPPKVTFKPSVDQTTHTPLNKLTSACPTNKSITIILEPSAQQTSACHTNEPVPPSSSITWYIIVIGFIIGTAIIVTTIVYTRKLCHTTCKPQASEYAKFVYSDKRVSLNTNDIPNVKHM